MILATVGTFSTKVTWYGRISSQKYYRRARQKSEV
jgi:hypothetical protein